jgi:hypothetical protein
MIIKLLNEQPGVRFCISIVPDKTSILRGGSGCNQTKEGLIPCNETLQSTSCAGQAPGKDQFS